MKKGISKCGKCSYDNAAYIDGYKQDTDKWYCSVGNDMHGSSYSECKKLLADKDRNNTIIPSLKYLYLIVWEGIN